ncbi:Mrp/NBP35 family ATP-binding protein [Desulfurispora thermophila]|uniref:Mrp/NBP35 family ATP-binding protein n=1 Tax=Desulfurispora thermophila TaxID=265470 RepID=UPI00036331DD|nr:Mrp/NBP35 family ATP-binding protein [Desulfurispora thermophila]
MSTDSKCSSCHQKDSGCTPDNCKKPEVLPQNEYNNIKNVIAVVSGKGGVGKSSVTALLALGLARQGYKVGIMDADITGPSIPKMFGIRQRPQQFDDKLLPVKSSDLGIPVISINLLLPNEDDPVIWRGPILAGAVKQFWTDVAWGSLDYLIVDLPPGTGDVPLTVMQSLPLNGIVVVTSPQELSRMVVRKAIKMARHMSVPIIGIVENMSYFKCPDCGKEVHIFGRSRLDDAASVEGLPVLEVLPIDPQLAELADRGRIEDYQTTAFRKPFLPGM